MRVHEGVRVRNCVRPCFCVHVRLCTRAWLCVCVFFDSWFVYLFVRLHVSARACFSSLKQEHDATPFVLSFAPNSVVGGEGGGSCRKRGEVAEKRGEVAEKGGEVAENRISPPFPPPPRKTREIAEKKGNLPKKGGTCRIFDFFLPISKCSKSKVQSSTKKF